MNNNCTSNGTLEKSGIPGDGYNGIGLNGSKYCLVSGNVCNDMLTTAAIPLNYDSYMGTTEDAPRTFPIHPSRYQNYGIVEYPHSPIH